MTDRLIRGFDVVVATTTGTVTVGGEMPIVVPAERVTVLPFASIDTLIRGFALVVATDCPEVVVRGEIPMVVPADRVTV